MPKTELISTAEAAKRKKCSRVAILDAIRRSVIDGVNTGRYFTVRANRKFEDWQPDLRRQQIGRDSQIDKRSK